MPPGSQQTQCPNRHYAQRSRLRNRIGNRPWDKQVGKIVGAGGTRIIEQAVARAGLNSKSPGITPAHPIKCGKADLLGSVTPYARVIVLTVTPCHTTSVLVRRRLKRRFPPCGAGSHALLVPFVSSVHDDSRCSYMPAKPFVMAIEEIIPWEDLRSVARVVRAVADVNRPEKPCGMSLH